MDNQKNISQNNSNKLEWLATAAFGLEGIVAKELKALGFRDAKGEMGGARFWATPEEAFRANLWLRCADRVLLILKEGEATTFEELFQFVKGIPWEKYLNKNAKFPVKGKCARSQLMSVRDCQAITKKAIVERLKSAYKLNWFSEDGSEHIIEISLHQNSARITMDSSGIALNKRGYRTWNGEAPIRETLAAALLHLMNWRPGMPLHDPCCGTGTILIEAAMMASNRAPGLTRSFSIEQWPFVNQGITQAYREEASAAFQKKNIINISGTDIDPEAIRLAKKHIVQAGFGGLITVWEQDLATLQLDMNSTFNQNGVFIANPPYGERLSDKKSSEALYKQLFLLKNRHPGFSIGVISSHPGFERYFGRRAAKKRRLYNGRLECEFFMY